jgi:hypothetical protein
MSVADLPLTWFQRPAQRAPKPYGVPALLDATTEEHRMKEIVNAIEPLFANEHFVEGLRQLVSRHGGDVAPSILFGPQDDEAQGPHIMVIDRRVVCDGRVVDLHRRPKTLAVFRAFCRTGSRFLSRDDLVERLYAMRIGPEHSRRIIECHYNNAIKMVSRARIEATVHLGGTRDAGIEWFVYDHGLKGWHFHRVHSYYRRLRLSRGLDS